MKTIHTNFQLPSSNTNISLTKVTLSPWTPSGEVGGGYGQFLLILYHMKDMHTNFQLPSSETVTVHVVYA